MFEVDTSHINFENHKLKINIDSDNPENKIDTHIKCFTLYEPGKGRNDRIELILRGGLAIFSGDHGEVMYGFGETLELKFFEDTELDYFHGKSRAPDKKGNSQWYEEKAKENFLYYLDQFADGKYQYDSETLENFGDEAFEDLPEEERTKLTNKYLSKFKYIYDGYSSDGELSIKFFMDNIHSKESTMELLKEKLNIDDVYEIFGSDNSSIYSAGRGASFQCCIHLKAVKKMYELSLLEENGNKV